MEQLDAQARFQLLNELRHRGFTHMKRLGSLCEAPCFHHASKGAHRIETIHSLSPFSPIVWILQTMMDKVACLSARSRTCKVSLRSPG